MALNPLDLQRLQVRLDNVRRIDPRDWIAGDDLEFRRLLKRLSKEVVTEQDYRVALQLLLEVESLEHRNRPNSPHRIMDRMMRGSPF